MAAWSIGLRAWRSRNLEYSRLAFERALEQLDLSLEAASAHPPRLTDLARVREALADYFVFDNDYGSSDVLWQKWFDAFALAGRRHRAQAPPHDKNSGDSGT